MSVIKVIEIIGTSTESWEAAAQEAVNRASSTIHNITGVEVIAQTATVKDGTVSEYRTTVHVAFELEDIHPEVGG